MWEAAEWEEANAKLGEKKKLRNRIELTWGFEELRWNLDDLEESKIWKANEEEKTQEAVGRKLPTILEEET